MYYTLFTPIIKEEILRVIYERKINEYLSSYFLFFFSFSVCLQLVCNLLENKRKFKDQRGDSLFKIFNHDVPRWNTLFPRATGKTLTRFADNFPSYHKSMQALV